VSVEDSAQALTAPSAGFTKPLIEPVLIPLKANNPAAANANAAKLNLAFFITTTNYRLNKMLLQNQFQELFYRWLTKGSYNTVEQETRYGRQGLCQNKHISIINFFNISMGVHGIKKLPGIVELIQQKSVFVFTW
jgi:hypothetical protein